MVEVARPVERFLALHYAFDGETVAGWFAVEPLSGRLFCYREMVQDRLGPAECGERLRRLTADERLSYAVANPDLFRKGKTFESVADVLSACRIDCQEAHGQSEARMARLRDYLTVRSLLTPGQGITESPLLVFTASAPVCATRVPAANFESEQACVLMVSYAVSSRPADEIRAKDPEAQRAELAEQQTREREQRRKKEGHSGRKSRGGW